MSRSFASLHLAACREADRRLLGQALYEIETATYVVVAQHPIERDRRDDGLLAYCYGNLAKCDGYVAGLERELIVVPMTAELKERLTAAKVLAYRQNPSR